MRNLSKILFVLLSSTLIHAHVGSPDVYYEGDAGPYHLFVTVRLPQVIPGVAEIQVRSASPDVQIIKVVPLRLTGPGSNLPSIPDVAERSKEDPQFFLGKLWFMEFGALQVRIDVEGSKGKAQLAVPVASFSRQRLSMNQGLHGLLAFCIGLLTFSVVLIVGPIVREATVPPGEVPQPANRMRSRIATGLTLIAIAGILLGGRAWWKVEAAAYDRNVDLLKPPQAETTLLNGNLLMIRPARQIMIPVASKFQFASKIAMEEVIADHGHVMHLFLIGQPGMEKMWHLHPELADGGAFAQKLPAMPAGQYKLFADIVDKNGYPWTLVGDVDLPRINGAATGGDDSVWQGPRVTAPVSETSVALLSDGARIVWERGDGPLKANLPASFKFRVETKDGSPVRDMEPYMGMVAHAQVVGTDLSIFAHLHPSGSVSMAALDLAQAGLAKRSAEGTPGMAMDMNMKMAHEGGMLPSEFKFPYGFPRAGDYRVFVQIKRLGKVETAAFDAHVQ
jgi:hypothetical protein